MKGLVAAMHEEEAERAAFRMEFRKAVSGRMLERLESIGRQKVHLRAARLAQYYIAGDADGAIAEPRAEVLEIVKQFRSLDRRFDAIHANIDELDWQSEEEKEPIIDELCKQYDHEVDAIIKSDAMAACHRGLEDYNQFHCLLDCLLRAADPFYTYHVSGAEAFIVKALAEMDRDKQWVMMDSDSHEPYYDFLQSRYSVSRNRHLQTKEMKEGFARLAVCSETIGNFTREMLSRGELFFMPLLLSCLQELTTECERVWALSKRAHGLDERGEKSRSITAPQDRDIAAFFLVRCLRIPTPSVISSLTAKVPTHPFKSKNHLLGRINSKGNSPQESGVRDWIRAATANARYHVHPSLLLSSIVGDKLHEFDLNSLVGD